MTFINPSEISVISTVIFYKPFNEKKMSFSLRLYFLATDSYGLDIYMLWNILNYCT